MEVGDWRFEVWILDFELWIWQLMPVVSADFFHLWPGGQGQEGLQVASHSQAVEDPEGNVSFDAA